VQSLHRVDAEPVHEARFRAMGSNAHVIIVASDPALVDRAVAGIEEYERRWSRFVETSEISELNRRPGADIEVSAPTRLLVERAVEAWRFTGGAFDPTVLGDVLRAGYDRSFDQLAALGTSVRPGSSQLGKGATNIVVGATTVRLPAGVGFDPGGIGKGLAADLVATDVLAAGADGICINLGGDLRVLGRAPVGNGWGVAIEHQLIAEPLTVVTLADGAVATSTTLCRHWRVDGATRHHLIDPWSGEPSTSDIALVTVVAGETWMAEALAKAELLRGSDRLFDLVRGTGADALAVTVDGRVLATAGMSRFVGAGGLPDRVELTVEAES
jgi:thiamine biosynthesis lipoprotein